MNKKTYKIILIFLMIIGTFMIYIPSSSFAQISSVARGTTKGRTTISSAIITLNKQSCIYTRYAINPKVTVKYNGKTLILGKDYVVTYSNNINPGTAKVIVTGIGMYNGSVTKKFTINKCPINNTKITLSKTSFRYTGKNITPSVSVIYGSTLKQGIDYTVSYSNNVNPGTAKVTITGKGKYTGTITKTFTINKSSLKDVKFYAYTTNPSEYTGKQIKPKVKLVNSGTVELKEGIDYTVSYSNNINVGTAKVTVTGKGNYTGSVSQTFQIKYHVMVQFDRSTGKVILTNKHNGKVLKEGTDYSVQYSYENDGYLKANITTKGNYFGGGCYRYKIVQRSISNTKITLSKTSFKYTGGAIKPSVTITYNGNTLKQGTDYTISYSNNVNVGTGKVTIKGQGLYTGSVIKSFTIYKNTTSNNTTKPTTSVSPSKPTTQVNLPY